MRLTKYKHFDHPDGGMVSTRKILWLESRITDTNSKLRMWIRRQLRKLKK